MTAYSDFAQIRSSSAASYHRLGRLLLKSLLGIVSPFGAVYLTLECWMERASQRRHLHTLSDHHLADIGRSRADAWREYSKPFWKP